jgi:predicted ATPase/DNA-binding CsgD family transcriptional regulator
VGENATDAAAGDVRGFPRALTSFVGRSVEVVEVAGLLAEYRMVTVTGPGGVGKTRLAGEVARQEAGRFADGAWLAELATVQDPELVPAVVAAALGLPQVADVPVTESLVAGAARQQLLLVLDNCEHVLGAVAELCGALLVAADDLRVLVTSREPVGVSGEARYRLRPLSVPEPGAPEANRSAAVALFADRARQADRRFVMDGKTGPVVARLVTRLDGMPLAIELAAARVEALGLGQLVDRIEDSFRLLTSRDRAAPPRHQSLTATVEWSYQLLGEQERQVFRRLAVFPGPFTLDAAVAVAGAAAEPVVLHLVDCSLVNPPRPGPDGRVRYLMLETLREFGLGLLTDAGEHPRTSAALARHALAVAEQAAAGMRTGTGELTAARCMDAEDATIHQALIWAQGHDSATALRLAIALSPWWNLRGRLAEGYALLSAAAGHAAPGSNAWCAAQYWLGQAAAATGHMTAGLGHYTAAVDAMEADAPSPALADALAGRANILLFLGRTPEGAEDARRALVLARELGYPAGEASALLFMSNAALDVDDFENAVQWARQACQIDQETIPGDSARNCRTFLTMALMEAGNVIAARDSCTDALALAREAGDVSVETFSLSLLAELDLRVGHLADAGAHLGAALKIFVQIRDSLGVWACLSLGGELCAAQGRWAEAVAVWAAHKAFADSSGLAPGAHTARRRQELLGKATLALGPDQMRAAQERGLAMSLETAAEFLLLLIEADSQAPAAPDVPSWRGELSARERELVTLVAQGRTDAQIAGQLYISVSTVRSHLDRIRDKTSCRRRADLTRLALQRGLA